jgi:long-chain acyl-CoA synthetase
MNSGHVLSAAAEGNPRMAAVVLKDERISCEQLDRATTSLAQWFFWQGCKPGDRVAVHWPNSIEAVKLFFACFKAGMTVVPPNVRMKAHEAAYVLEHRRALMYFALDWFLGLSRSVAVNCDSSAPVTRAENRHRFRGFLTNDLP